MVRIKKLNKVKHEWKEVPLSTICEIRRGASPRPISKHITTKSDGVNWIRIGDVVNNKINKTEQKITKHASTMSVLVEKGDLLLSNSMSFGRPYIVNINGCIHDGWLAITEKTEKINKVYLYYFLQSDKAKVFFELMSAGSGVRNLNAQIVSKLMITLPTMKEQQKIATALSDMDDLIESLEKIIEKKKKIKQGTMQQLLTGEKRLPGYFGKWREYKLNDVMLDFQNGYAFSSSDYKDSGVPIITMAQIGLDGQFIKDENYINYASYETLKLLPKFVVNNKDVIIAMTDVTPQKNLIGRMTKVKGIEKALLNQRVGLIRLDDKIIIPKLLVELSNMRGLRSYFKAIASLGVQSNISTRDIGKAIFKLPSDINEQQAIAEILSDMDAEIEALEEKLEKYKKLKEGMMQELLTGRIRLV